MYSNDDGQLLGEYLSGTGTPPVPIPVREYIYLEGERVAMLNYNNSVSPPTVEKIFLANNHIGQAQYGWDEWGNPRYSHLQTPFGEGMIEANGIVNVPVKFPGQIADGETGFNQNWNRDYDPSLGRYLQSDPIGLEGGINTFAYVENNPVMMVDPEGLEGYGGAIGGAIGGGILGGGSYGGSPGTGAAKGLTGGAKEACECVKFRPPDFFMASGSWWILSGSISATHDSSGWHMYFGKGTTSPKPGTSGEKPKPHMPGYIVGAGWLDKCNPTDADIGNHLNGASLGITVGAGNFAFGKNRSTDGSTSTVLGRGSPGLGGSWGQSDEW